MTDETWWAKARRIICEECDQYWEGRCLEHRGATGCFRKRRLAVCPAKPPKWGPINPLEPVAGRPQRSLPAGKQGLDLTSNEVVG